MSIDALEHALQTAWDPETAAVYADLLTARGDPRGELIALDLNAPTPAIAIRKHALTRSWLGTGDPWDRCTVEHGLVCGLYLSPTTAPIVDRVTGVNTVIGNRFRDLMLYGSIDDLESGLDALARFDGGLPWLRRLTLQCGGNTRPITRAIWERMIAATPHLGELGLIGTGVVASPHPNVRALKLQGLAIAVGREPFRGVTHLEFQFRDQPYSSEPQPLEHRVALVNPRAFPDLRVLDISHNIALRWETPARPPALVFLETVEQLERFERIRIPQITSASSGELIAILERCPRLVIEIARIYETLDVTHPRLLVPTPRVWPEQPHGRDAVSLEIEGGKHGDELALSSLVSDLEDQFDAMPPDAQAAWIAFWEFLDDLGWEDEAGDAIRMVMPVAMLLTALDAIHGNRRAERVLEDLRDAKLPADATVMISRYWGW